MLRGRICKNGEKCKREERDWQGKERLEVGAGKLKMIKDEDGKFHEREMKGK